MIIVFNSGLGAMGGNMAINLAKKFEDLHIFDILPENVNKVLESCPKAQGRNSRLV